MTGVRNIFKLALVSVIVVLAYGSDVIPLKDSDFETESKQYEVLLVKFYAPWSAYSFFIVQHLTFLKNIHFYSRKL